MRLINLTPHTVRIYREGEVVLTLPSSGEARVYPKEDNLGVLEVESTGVKIPVYSTTGFGMVVNLPAEQPGVGYIVSRIVAGHLSNRSDLFVPGHTVRNAEGVIIGCECLMRI